MGAHQKSIDSIEEEGEGLVPHPLDDPSPLKEEIDEIITNWKDICDLSLKKQERLEAAKKVVTYSNILYYEVCRVHLSSVRECVSYGVG